MGPWLVLLYSATTGLKIEKGLGTGLGLLLWTVSELKVDMEMWLEPGRIGRDVGLRLRSELSCVVLCDGPEVGSRQELRVVSELESQLGQR